MWMLGQQSMAVCCLVSGGPGSNALPSMQTAHPLTPSDTHQGPCCMRCPQALHYSHVLKVAAKVAAVVVGTSGVAGLAYLIATIAMKAV
jgi:hypothetical protein